MSDWKIRYNQAVKELQDYLFYNKGLSTNLFYRTQFGVSGATGVLKQITIACNDELTIVITSWLETEKYPQRKLTEAVERFLEIPNDSYDAGWRVGWPNNYIQWVDPKGIAQKKHVVCDKYGKPLTQQYKQYKGNKMDLDTLLKQTTTQHDSEIYLLQRGFYHEMNSWHRCVDVTADDNEDCKYTIELIADSYYSNTGKWRLDVMVRPSKNADVQFCVFAASHECIDVTEAGDFSSLYYERVEDCFNELSMRIMKIYETLKSLDGGNNG